MVKSLFCKLTCERHFVYGLNEAQTDFENLILKEDFLKTNFFQAHVTVLYLLLLARSQDEDYYFVWGR